MAKITRLPSGNYNVRVYNKKLKKTISITAKSKDEVKRQLAAYEMDMEDIEFPKVEKAE